MNVLFNQDDEGIFLTGTEDTVEVTRQDVRLAELQSHPSNYNRHSEAQIARIAKSLQTFGQVRSIVVWHNTILAGHGVVLAAKSLGWESIRADVLPDDYAEDKALAYVVADNELARQSDPDQAQLAAILEELQAKEPLLVEAAGYSSAELEQLLKMVNPKPPVDAPAQVDRASELQAKWQTATGQLWQLGDHRLICGDCTDAAVVARVMGGECATLAPVDPPYNVGFDYDGETVDDSKQAEVYEQFSRAWFGVCQSVSERQLVTPGCNNLALWMRWFNAYHWGTWIKTNSMTNGRTSRFWCWEPVLFFGEHWGKKRHSDVFDFPIGQQKDTANHPCPKPLKMWIDIVENYSDLGDSIFESFGGSGTTIIACEQLGRKCRAVEISEGYIGVALERYFQATGKTPELLERA